MAQRNSETDGMVMGLALVGAAVFIMFFIFYALACFAAIVFTILALCALDRDITIYKWTTTPREARIFLSCGIAGLIGLPVFVIFCAALLHARVPPEWWGYILLGGYSFGALGFSALIFEEEQKKEAANFLTLQTPPPAAPFSLPSSPYGGPGGGSSSAPFQFASWDDEMPDSADARNGSDSRALTIVQPAANVPDAGRDCRGCGFNAQLSDEDIRRIVAKYTGGLP